MKRCLIQGKVGKDLLNKIHNIFSIPFNEKRAFQNKEEIEAENRETKTKIQNKF